jgi:hypothetical protein
LRAATAALTLVNGWREYLPKEVFIVQGQWFRQKSFVGYRGKLLSCDAVLFKRRL